MSETLPPQTPTGSSPDRDTQPAEWSSYLDGLSAHVLQNAGRRTSGAIEHILLEAELVDEGETLDNPAIPAERIMEDVLETLDRRDLDPAWIVCRGDGE